MAQRKKLVARVELELQVGNAAMEVKKRDDAETARFSGVVSPVIVLVDEDRSWDLQLKTPPRRRSSSGS